MRAGVGYGVLQHALILNSELADNEYLAKSDLRGDGGKTVAHIVTVPGINADKIEVRVCSDEVPSRCVLLGHVHRHSIRGSWWITPQTGRNIRRSFGTEAEAQRALIDYERAACRAVCEKRLKGQDRAKGTLALLAQL
jgi:hypothetical protein